MLQAKQHFLYLRPDPHGQGSLRPGFFRREALTGPGFVGNSWDLRRCEIRLGVLKKLNPSFARS